MSVLGAIYNRRRLVLVALVLLTAALVWWLPAGAGPAGAWQQLAVFVLLWIWPAVTWSGRLSGTRSTRWLAAAGLALLLNLLATLVIHYLPGPVPRPALLLAALAVALVPLAGTPDTVRANADGDTTRRERRRPGVVAGPGQGPVAWLLVLLLLVGALGLRAGELGYKELQGDEGLIMQRAAAALEGDDEALFRHQKGPAEILIPLQTWGLAGVATDFWLKWPFVWAGLLAVAVLMALAGRWAARRDGPMRLPVALLAGSLFATGGLAVAFSRIIQYQSLVMFWGLLAVLLADRYGESGEGRDLRLSTIFLAGGLLAHYDAVLVTPAMAWLLGRGVWRQGGLSPYTALAQLRSWGPALLLGGGILALFYLPFGLSPGFGPTLDYLLNERVGTGSAVHWSGGRAWQMASFYNSVYYLSALGLGLLLAVRRAPVAAWSLFLAPLLFYTVLVVDPRTHIYTLFPGAAIVAALGWSGAWQAAGRAPIRRAWRGLTRTAVVAGLALLLVPSVFYVYLMLVQTQPERQRTWTENRPAGFPVTWTEPPRFGLFGFPYQAGWRVVADLLGPESMPYASNEEAEITNWYLAQAPRTFCADFATFLLAENVQDEVPFDPAWLTGLYLQARITVDGRPTLQIWGRQPAGAIFTVPAERRQRWLRPAQVAAPQSGWQIPRTETLGGAVALRGYSLDASQAFPGGQLVVTLYWEALAPFSRNYQVFVHLWDGQRIVAQHDGAPACAVYPTTRWEVGQIVADAHVIDISAHERPGTYQLLTGMYDLLTLDRLPLTGTPGDVIILQNQRLSPAP